MVNATTYRAESLAAAVLLTQVRVRNHVQLRRKEEEDGRGHRGENVGEADAFNEPDVPGPEDDAGVATVEGIRVPRQPGISLTPYQKRRDADGKWHHGGVQRVACRGGLNIARR